MSNVTDNLNMTLWSRASQTDKEVSGSIAVFNGNTSFAIWRKGSRGPVANVRISTELLKAYVKVIPKLVNQGPKGKIRLKLEEYDRNEKKFKEVGFFILGLNEKMTPYFGFSGPSGQFAFPIFMKRPHFLNSDDIDQKDAAEITLEAVLSDIRDRAILLESLSNKKRDANSNGGKGNWNKGNSNNNSGGSSSGSNDLDDELPF